MKTINNTSKFLSILIVLAMCLGILPISVFAADTTYTVTLAVNRTDLGSVEGDGEYVNGTAVTLTATANYDNVFFAYWLDNSVTLSEEPTAAELEAAIVSYDSTYTFAAAQNISLTAVFAYNSSISVNGIYYTNEDEVFSGEGSGNYIEEIATTTEIGKQSVTISASDYDKFVTIDDVVYERNCMFTWTYDQTTEQTIYTTHDSFSIPVAPLYDSVEYWAYLAEYEVPVTVAYVPHTHSYSAATCTTPATCSCGATTGGVDSTNHTYDGDTDAVCDTCDYTRLILVADKAVVNGNGTVTLTSSLSAKPICSDSRYQEYISGSGLNWSFQMKNNVTTDLTFTVTFGSQTASCTVSFVQDPNALILTPSSTSLVGNGTITLTANKDITGITCSNQSYETDISGSGANWQFVMNRNADVNLWFEATAADGETALCWITFTSSTHTHSYTKEAYHSVGHWTACDCGEKTEVQAHSYTGILDATCDCGYNRELFVTNDDGKDFFEVGFIPGDGVTLPDDAELVVEDHYPSLAPIASTVVPTAETEYVDIPEENISRLEDIVDGYKLGEIIVINGEKYMVFGGADVYVHLIRLTDNAEFIYNVRESMLVPHFSPYDVEIQTNRTIVINGAKYDVFATIAHNGIEQYAVLYVDGVLAGLYIPSENSADFVEGYDPETLKAQQDDNDLGSVTIPADYNNAAIADFAPGKTYKVSVIGSNDISVEGYDDALLNSITGDTPEIVAAKAELERLKADMDAKRAALDQLDANNPDHMEGWAAWYEAVEAYEDALASLADLTNLKGATVSQTFKIPDALVGVKNVKYVAVHDTNPFADDLAYWEHEMKGSPGDEHIQRLYEDAKARYDAWEEENGSGAEFGTVTLSLDGLTLTATHTAVKGFSPFIVYAFVEADEPEYKELSATLHTEHTGGTATCKTRAVCEICGESYSELAAHTYENGKCTVCGEADQTVAPPTNDGLTDSAITLIVICSVLVLAGGSFAVYWFVFRKKKEQ